jgi:hypothetical protein
MRHLDLTPMHLDITQATSYNLSFHKTCHPVQQGHQCFVPNIKQAEEGSGGSDRKAFSLRQQLTFDLKYKKYCISI